MSKKPREWDYSCPDDDCQNRFEADPVSNVVLCGVCGSEMVVYAIAEGA